MNTTIYGHLCWHTLYENTNTNTFLKYNYILICLNTNTEVFDPTCN